MNRKNQTRVVNALNFIKETKATRISVQDVANSAGCSRWQLQRDFHNSLEMSTSNYISSLKLSKAAEDLITTKNKIVDIALKYGFEADSNFTRSFKKHYGITPKMYRSENKLNNIFKGFELVEFVNRFNSEEKNQFVKLEVKTTPKIVLHGKKITINDIFSKSCEIQKKIPECWKDLKSTIKELDKLKVDDQLVGVWDIKYAYSNDNCATYFACVQSSYSIPELAKIIIPEQTYIYLDVCCHAIDLQPLVEWLVQFWLPKSNYLSLATYDLEFYDINETKILGPLHIKYAIPITPKTISGIRKITS